MTAVTALRINSVYLSASIPLLRASCEFTQPISCPWPAWPACLPHDFPPSQVPRLSCSSWFRDDVQFESNRPSTSILLGICSSSAIIRPFHTLVRESETDDVRARQTPALLSTDAVKGCDVSAKVLVPPHNKSVGVCRLGSTLQGTQIHNFQNGRSSSHP